nr:MAG TPA: hypothetical protein [Caudoviricetes sp.]
MEIIRQNSDDRCVAGRRIWVSNPQGNNKSDKFGYLDEKLTQKVSYEELINAFRKGNLMICYYNHLNQLIEAQALTLCSQYSESDKAQCASVRYAEDGIEASVNDTNTAYYNFPIVISEDDPNYVPPEPVSP